MKNNFPERITISLSILQYSVTPEYSIKEVMSKIESNEKGIAFCVDELGILQGSISDGDIRRWMMSKSTVNLNSLKVNEIINKNCISVFKDSIEKVDQHFNDRSLKAVPIIDRNKRLYAIATEANKSFEISNHIINNDNKIFVIGEIGNNHQGSLENAKKLIKIASNAGASAAKFQLRDLSCLYDLNDNKNKLEDLGTEYTIDLLKRFQLSDDDLFKAFDYCHTLGITPLCTPWDITSVEKLEKYGIEGYKIASADFTNTELIKAVVKTRKPMICSTGMCSDSEIVSGIKNLKNQYANFALLHCNSTYPAPFKDINLRYIEKLSKLGKCIVGYSSHERGFSAILAAVGLGARIIEKHITLDKTWEGIDHRVSLIYSEFNNMIKEINDANQSLGLGDSRYLSQGEIINRENLGKSIFASKNIELGEVFTHDSFRIMSPGKGLSPYYKDDLIGVKAKRNFKEGDILEMSDLKNDAVVGREYVFNRPFGLPVRYHDAVNLIEQTNANLVEFHLSYRDLERDYSDFISKEKIERLPEKFVVHCPELFAGDHLLDLCTNDESYREESIKNLQNTINATNKLKRIFPNHEKPIIVVNVGGFTLDNHLSKEERYILYDNLKESLQMIDHSEVRLCPQTMPPFPWHFGGQRYHNLFIYPDEINKYSKELELEICLDISHSKLACNYYKIDFLEFLKTVLPVTSHMHISDSSGVDGEGLQIGDGDINFAEFSPLINNLNPYASFIPEVWQGHKNNGEGFWKALNYLEEIF